MKTFTNCWLWCVFCLFALWRTLLLFANLSFAVISCVTFIWLYICMCFMHCTLAITIVDLVAVRFLNCALNLFIFKLADMRSISGKWMFDMSACEHNCTSSRSHIHFMIDVRPKTHTKYIFYFFFWQINMHLDDQCLSISFFLFFYFLCSWSLKSLLND